MYVIQGKETFTYLPPFSFLIYCRVCWLIRAAGGLILLPTRGQLTSFFFLFFFYFLVFFLLRFKSNQMKQKKGKKKKRGDITRMGGDVERPDIPHYAITDGAVCVCVLLLCFLRFSV